MEKKPMTSVTKEVNKRFLIDKFFASYQESMVAGKPIFIQQDNARYHVDPNDVGFCRIAKKGGFKFQLTCQPPNFPDLNLLDLGFFQCHTVFTT